MIMLHMMSGRTIILSRFKNKSPKSAMRLMTWNSGVTTETGDGRAALMRNVPVLPEISEALGGFCNQAIVSAIDDVSICRTRGNVSTAATTPRARAVTGKPV